MTVDVKGGNNGYEKSGIGYGELTLGTGKVTMGMEKWHWTWQIDIRYVDVTMGMGI